MGGIGSGRRPNPNRSITARKKRVPASAIEVALREAHARGATLSSVLTAVPISYPTAAVHARKIGLKFTHGKSGASAENKRRIPVIVALYRDGYTLEQIGAQYGITRERVRQILKKHCGLAAKDGGAFVRGERKKSARANARESRTLGKHGCTAAQLIQLRQFGRDMVAAGIGIDRTPIRAFGMQRSNAHRRGIGWDFKLWEWWQLWRESGHWQDRGRGQGYVMCRIGDSGPYAPGNVFIGLATENSANTRNKKSGLPTGVRYIKRGKYERYVAQRMIGGKKRVLGYFRTPELARAAYLAIPDAGQEAA